MNPWTSRIQPIGYRGEARHVDEEHCDLFALAFKGSLRVENLLGEVLGGVRVGRANAVLASGWSPDRLAALQTKLRASRQLCSALTAPVREPSPALQAELRLGGVLVLTPGTLHPGLPLGGDAEVETVEGD
jgi:hypothetical protein